MKLENELAELEEESSALTARWNEEKKSLHSVQKLKEEIDKARQELEIAQRRGNLARAGELAYGVIPDLERKLKAAEEKGSDRLVNEAVTEEHIAGVVSRWTGIPVDKMLEGEREKLLHMEDAPGQARRRPGRGGARGRQRGAPRARAGLQDPNRPIGSFLFLGPTGRRQDRTHQGAGGVPVRRRHRDGAHRHVGIHGEAFGRAADRRAAGLCRL